jgi:phosphatidate cytidylyltransferase
MFKQRLISSLVLIPLVWIIICVAQAPLFFLVALGLIAIMAFEWAALVPFNKRTLWTCVHILLGLLIFVPQLNKFIMFSGMFIMPLALLLWLMLIVLIISYPHATKFWSRPGVVASFSLLLLTDFAVSLSQIYVMPQGSELLIYLLLIVWSVDIGAYVTGKWFGSHKLVPLLSPGKTYEGLMGGLVLAACVVYLGILYFSFDNQLYYFINGMLAAVFAVFGDLFISMLKRRANLKDTGNLIPGHGGLLDRLDSLLAALPCFCLGLQLSKFFSGIHA